MFLGLSAFNKNKIGLKNIPPPIPTIPEIKPRKEHRTGVARRKIKRKRTNA